MCRRNQLNRDEKSKKVKDQIFSKKEALVNLVNRCKAMKSEKVIDQILDKRETLADQAIEC